MVAYLHLIHTLLKVPMHKGLPLEHSSKLLADTAEQLLDGGRVAKECDGHLEATRWDVALCSEHIVRNPLDKVRRVLVLNVLHLLLNLLHRHLATEDSGNCEVTTMTGIASSHHVLGIKHLLSKLRDCDSSVLLATPRGEWRIAGYKEV